MDEKLKPDVEPQGLFDRLHNIGEAVLKKAEEDIPDMSWKKLVLVVLGSMLIGLLAMFGWSKFKTTTDDSEEETFIGRKKPLGWFRKARLRHKYNVVKPAITLTILTVITWVGLVAFAVISFIYPYLGEGGKILYAVSFLMPFFFIPRIYGGIENFIIRQYLASEERKIKREQRKEALRLYHQRSARTAPGLTYWQVICAWFLLSFSITMLAGAIFIAVDHGSKYTFINPNAALPTYTHDYNRDSTTSFALRPHQYHYKASSLDEVYSTWPETKEWTLICQKEERIKLNGAFEGILCAIGLFAGIGLSCFSFCLIFGNTHKEMDYDE